MSVVEQYRIWRQNVIEDEDIISELKEIENNSDEIYERFYKELEFGTAGLRGILGAGTNRMNVYTVRKTTQGLANYLKNNHKNPSVAISYDSRIKSEDFARETACVLAANGVKSYIVNELQPTPFLSFLVRELDCQAGVMITASHNPAKYNGYKCYGADGCQMTDADASSVYDNIKDVDIFSGVSHMDFDSALKSGLISFVEDELYERYVEKVKEQCINKGICIGSKLKVVYTPLNGAGNKLVRRVLDDIGIKNVEVVKEQEYPDGNFPTCEYPNPEFKEALSLAIDLAKEEDADLVLSTDPDSDRVGIAVKHNGEYRLMSGNEVGIIFTDYILSNRKKLGTLPEGPVIVKSIVSSIMVDIIAKEYGCEVRNVLTGFKYIGDQILRLERDNQESRYVFGFEESYGYLIGTYVRDKDAVVASMLICEMAEYYRKQGKSLCDVINQLYARYGYYSSTTFSFSFEGSSGMKKIGNIMEYLRNEKISSIAGLRVETINDYIKLESLSLDDNNTNKINLPKSNVISYSLEGGMEVIVRPSGTEPKIKIYVTSIGENYDDAKHKTDDIIENVKSILNI